MRQEAEDLIHLLCTNDMALYDEVKHKFTVPECDEIARRTGVPRTVILYEYYYGNKE